jgi:hypothetical protein
MLFEFLLTLCDSFELFFDTFLSMFSDPKDKLGLGGRL